MTCYKLQEFFPDTFCIRIRLTSFDILDALSRAQELFKPHIVALCMGGICENTRLMLERLFSLRILVYAVTDEADAEEAVSMGRERGAEVFIGGGTVCVISDRIGLKRVYIAAREEVVREAVLEAVQAAKTITAERMRAHMVRQILNGSKDGLLACDPLGRIIACNDQMIRFFHIPPESPIEGRPAQELFPMLKLSLHELGQDEIIEFAGTSYFVEYKPIADAAGIIISVRNTECIIKAEDKVRRSLYEKGLAAKYTFQDIIGRAGGLRQSVLMAQKFSQVDSNVLIVGETGTGKELFGHSIHNASKRRNEPFVAFNCAAIPESLLESELFGYEPHAFSGASRTGKAGLFEVAHKGTVFLDEIGEIPVSLQAKLLRVLQEKEIRRIGSSVTKPIDVRIISATNINLKEMIEGGKFRSDLYYRLNLLDICIPPLRERRDDIPVIIDFYIRLLSKELGKPIPRIHEQALAILKNYDWPGNVRELRNFCERAIVLNDSGEIGEKELSLLNIFQVGRPAPAEKPYLKLRKEDIARDMGISRTTLWRWEKRRQK